MSRIHPIFLGLVCLAIGAGGGAGLVGIQGSAAALADETKKDEAKKEEPLDVRYARLFLKQAQIDLERALEINRRMPGSFQSVIIDSLRATVSVAQDWLDEALAESKSADFNPCLKTADSLAKTARDNYSKIQEIERLAPKSVNPSDLERAKVALELAEIRIQRAKAVDVKSPTSVMQMQIDLLREQMVEMYTEVAKLQARN